MSGGAQDDAGKGVEGLRTCPPRLRPGDRTVVVASTGPVGSVHPETGCGRILEIGLDMAVGRHAFERAASVGRAAAPAVRHGLAGTVVTLDIYAGVLPPDVTR